MVTHQLSHVLHTASTPDAEGSAITLVDVSKRFSRGKKARLAVNHLTLQVPMGGVFGLLGPNGAGKTTTINMMIGLEKPTSGSIHVLGLDVRDPRALRALRAQLGVVSQGTALHNELTALQNLNYYGGLFGMAGRSKRDRIQHVLQVVKLDDVQHDRVSTFSGGMKRRLAIARALVPDPEMLILDEPTTGIDVQTRHGIWRHIESLGKQGKTILLTTNTLDEAQALCQRLAIIDHGKLLVEDTLSHLTAQYGDGTMEVETTEVTRMAPTLRALPGVVAVQQDGVLLRVIARGMTNQLSAQVVSILVRESDVVRYQVKKPTLDEIFLSLTGAAVRD